MKSKKLAGLLIQVHLQDPILTDPLLRFILNEEDWYNHMLGIFAHNNDEDFYREFLQLVYHNASPDTISQFHLDYFNKLGEVAK